MEFGTEFMFINEDDAPSIVPGMITLLQLDPNLKPYRKEIEQRCTFARLHIHTSNIPVEASPGGLAQPLESWNVQRSKNDSSDGCLWMSNRGVSRRGRRNSVN